MTFAMPDLFTLRPDLFTLRMVWNLMLAIAILGTVSSSVFLGMAIVAAGRYPHHRWWQWTPE